VRALAAIVIGLILGLASHGGVWAAPPIAYVTEIQRSGGDVHVRASGDPEWTIPRPLLALSAGDQVRVTGQARLVVLYHADARTVTVTAANSPVTITPAPDTLRGEQVRVLTSAVTQFFMTKQSAPQLRQAVTRGDTVVIISPRHTRLLPGPVVFEWEGPDNLKYGVRIVGPEGTLWTQIGLSRTPLRYPTTAPMLASGIRYTWELEVPGRGRQSSSFEVVPDADAARIRSGLTALDRATDGYPRTTVALMQAAVLFEEGLFDDARRALEEAASDDPREATVRFVLGHVYDHIGLGLKASRAFDEANDLITATGR